MGGSTLELDRHQRRDDVRVRGRADAAPDARARALLHRSLQQTAGNAAMVALARAASGDARAWTSSARLDASTRGALVASFGARARDVPVEASSDAAADAEGLTIAARVHLAPGRFDTESYEGRVLLGHEVAHALQQERGAEPSPEPDATRAALEVEAEQAGRAFAQGRPFAVRGRAPVSAPLFRGGDDVEVPEAEAKLEAALREVEQKQADRAAAIARYRKERHDYIAAHREWAEYDVPVDAALRKTAGGLQRHELDIRLLQTAFGKGGSSISREDAEEVLRRMRWTSYSVEDDSIGEQIQTRATIRYRTQDMRLAVEIYNELIEDRRRRWIEVDEILNAGPDMPWEMLKDVGRGVYNGAVGFAQGLVDLPAAPVNLVQTLRGEEPVHIIDLSGLRVGYHTYYGVHYGTSIEVGTQLGLTFVSGKLPTGPATGAAATASTATQASRATSLLSTWMKVSAVTTGATVVIQAGQAVRDIVRGYTIRDGQRVPLTEDDILERLAGITFGLHTAAGALGARRAEPSRGAPERGAAVEVARAPAVTPDLLIERPTPSTLRASVPGEGGALVIDETGWRVLSRDGRVVIEGPPEEAALLAGRLTGDFPVAPAPAAPAGAAPTSTAPTSAAPPLAPTPSQRALPPAGETARATESPTETTTAPRELTPPPEIARPRPLPPEEVSPAAEAPLTVPGEIIEIVGEAPRRAPAEDIAPPTEVAPRAAEPEPTNEPEAAQAEPAEEPAAERPRRVSAKATKREAARARLQEAVDEVEQNIKDAEADGERTQREIRRRNKRVADLRRELESAEGADKARIEEEIARLEYELTQEEGGGYLDQAKGDELKLYRLRRYLRSLKEALTLRRPSLWAATKRLILERASRPSEKFPNGQRLPDGRWLDYNTGNVIADKVVFGHAFGREHWRLALEAVEQKMTQAQFDAWVNRHPEWFQIESKAENESHQHENHEE